MRPTLTQYLLQHLIDHPKQQELTLIMADIESIGKYISREVNKAGVADILGKAGTTNIQDEEVQKLDVVANEKTKEYLKETGHFFALASEEEGGVVDMQGRGGAADYVIAFDPLDGSKNIDVNVSVGTIFSVHKKIDGEPANSEKHFLQSGRAQVLAGYVLYGSSTVLVFTFGDGVHEFTLDPSIGEFLLSRERVAIPDECTYYSVNEANTEYFRDFDQTFVQQLKQQGCNARYIGSLVADVHRNIVKGGVFLYPAVDKDQSNTFKAKLRLNYEAKPLAFIVEQAGGAATDGAISIMDIEPRELHQRITLVIGNQKQVVEYTQHFSEQ